MAFPRKLLTEDEEIVREFRPHWRMLAIPVLWVVAAIVAIVLVYQWIPPADGTVDLITSLVIVAALIPLAVGPFINWWFTAYVLTNERLITRSGVIARQGVEIPLENINNVLFSQNVVERVLKSGDLLIESAGESGQSRFSDIPDPEEFQALLYRTRELHTDRKGARGAALSQDQVPQRPDPTEQLERLARLHREGVLTDEEFAQKKQALLDQM
jgi:uncharacterized membrane protein YdbT with pleckstrin-like domain